MTALVVGICTILGLAVGSFLCVVIVRVPAGESVVAPPSKCPNCGSGIEPRDNIPVLSWLLLRGKCRNCGEPIHWGYPVVESLNALLWAVTAYHFRPRYRVPTSHELALLIPFLLLFSCLLALAAIDIQIYRLPDKLTIGFLAPSAVMIVAGSIIVGEPRAIIGAAIGGAFYWLFLFVPALVYPKGMGFGDVKLAGLMGLYLGWIGSLVKPDSLHNGTARLVLGGVTLPLFSLMIASVVGVVIGLGVMVARKGKSEPFPFGPWLALGCVLAVLFSHQLLGNM